METPDNSLPQCRLDRDVINTETFSQMQDFGLTFFASLCGRNRGIFVVDPPDGHTYSCLELPSQWWPSESSGHQVNDIKNAFFDQTLSTEETLDLLDDLTQAVYQSSANVASDPYACNVNGLATLQQCSTTTRDEIPIRAVTLAGLLAPAPWATNGIELTWEQARTAYTPQDFQDMVHLGLNTVLIPIQGDLTNVELQDVLGDILDSVDQAGLKAILSLQQEEHLLEAIAEISATAVQNLLGLQLPPTIQHKPDQLAKIRQLVASDVGLFLSINEGDLQFLDNYGDTRIYGALSKSHSTIVSDVASSTSVEDRQKLVYHEAMACLDRSPLEYAACWKKVPIFLASGLDLTIDDCTLENTADYGQCGRFDETIQSDWWFRHRKSFLARQLFSLEHGMGWSFSTWKLLNQHDDDATLGITKPAHLMALQNVAAAGLFPDDFELACLNPPDQDFILGDDTLAPTPAPPPDCGNGWWNYDWNACEYWVPPQDVLASSTSNRQQPPDGGMWGNPPELQGSNIGETDQNVFKDSGDTKVAESYIAAGFSLLIGLVVVKSILSVRNRRQSQYVVVPNADN